MATRNQNRAPKSPPNKIGGGADIPFDKRRRIGGMRTAGPFSSGRTRQVFSSINTNQEVSRPTSSAGPAPAESVENVEFTKEEIDTLLNEKIKGKKFDLKGKLEQLAESNKKLRICIRWFQGVEHGLNEEQEKLRNSVEAAENKCKEIDTESKKREEKLNAAIEEMKQNITNLEAKLEHEESEKMDAIQMYRQEHQAKVAADEVNDSLTKELKKVEEEKLDSEQKRSYIEEQHQRAQIYNNSLQQFSTKLQADLQKASDSLKKVEEDKSAAVEALGELRLQYKTLMEQITSTRASLEDTLKKKDQLEDEARVLRGELQLVRDERDRQITVIQGLSDELVKRKETIVKSVQEVDDFMRKTIVLEETCTSQSKQLDILQSQLNAANERLKMADMSQSETLARFDEQKRLISDLSNRLAEAEQQIAEGEKLRKKLHNTILELKGNIRVFCRVRPLLPEESSNIDAQAISYPTSTEARDRGIDLLQNGQKYPFTFDKVFNHNASQNDVFVEISQLVQSALDGYKVCIFAYGQTGSGKTYTMMGRPEHSDQKGLIPRSLEQIFQASQNLSSQGWKYKMQASVLEIYNETIRDLLSTSRSSSENGRVENSAAEKKYTIKHDANGNVYVSDLTVVDVCSSREVSSLLCQAAQSRSVGKTQMNEHSSRSHFVFTLRISGVNESTDQQVHGILNLIDLAGSERLSKSGATGDRLKETQAINKSLSSLADVILSLTKKEEHVPYRNSKLTYLLQPCLGGDSKTLMFVNVSPDPSSVSESLCSLKFAARVNDCEIGVPRRQTSMKSDSRLSYG